MEAKIKPDSIGGEDKGEGEQKKREQAELGKREQAGLGNVPAEVSLSPRAEMSSSRLLDLPSWLWITIVIAAWAGIIVGVVLVTH